jgi:hypothetical protein
MPDTVLGKGGFHSRYYASFNSYLIYLNDIK